MIDDDEKLVALVREYLQPHGSISPLPTPGKPKAVHCRCSDNNGSV